MVIQIDLNARIFLELTEGEAHALAGICGYERDAFLEWFYKNMGRSYLEPHEQHVKSLFEKARKLDYAIRQLEDARKLIKVIKTD